jgi:hypothetical protein
MENRDSMIIYRSFYEAIKELPEKEQAILWNAVFSYGLDFITPELFGICKTVFTLIKPQLDANIKRYENGKKPKSEQIKSKTEAKQKQTVSKTVTNVNVNENDNVNPNENGNLGRQKEEIQDNLFVSVVQNKRWIETMAMNHKTDIDLVKGHLRTFYFHCIAYDHWKTTESKVMQHFNNWVIKGNPIPQPKINTNFEGW